MNLFNYGVIFIGVHCELQYYPNNNYLSIQKNMNDTHLQLSGIAIMAIIY